MARIRSRTTRALRQGGSRSRTVSPVIRESGYTERAMFPRQLRNGRSSQGTSESPNPTRGLRGPSRG